MTSAATSTTDRWDAVIIGAGITSPDRGSTGEDLHSPGS